MSEENEKSDHVARVWNLIDAIVPWGLFVFAVLGASLLLVVAGWVLFDFFTVLDDPPLKDGVNDRAAVRNVGLVLAALVAGGFAIWRAEIARRATAAAEAQVTRQQDRDYADLFTKAVEQLGTTREIRSRKKDEKGTEHDVYDYKPNIEVRLGAIYALERISQDSERDHIAVMETLCAYVRENAPIEECRDFPISLLSGQKCTTQSNTLSLTAASKWWEKTFRRSIREWIDQLPPLRADIQAILTVIGRRQKDRIRYEIGSNVEEPGYRLDLRSTNLRKLVLKNANLENCIFSNSHLEGAKITKSQLNRVDLTDSRMLRAFLVSSHLNKANLFRAHMIGSVLEEVTMTDSWLRESKFEAASLHKAVIKKCNLGDAFLERTELGETDMDSAITNFANFTNATSLSQASIDKAFGCSGTILPKHLTRPQHWHPEAVENLSLRGPLYGLWKAAREAGERPPWVLEEDWKGWP